MEVEVEDETGMSFESLTGCWAEGWNMMVVLGRGEVSHQAPEIVWDGYGVNKLGKALGDESVFQVGD